MEVVIMPPSSSESEEELLSELVEESEPLLVSDVPDLEKIS